MKWTTGPSLGDAAILVEIVVHNRGSNLEHQRHCQLNRARLTLGGRRGARCGRLALGRSAGSTKANSTSPGYASKIEVRPPSGARCRYRNRIDIFEGFLTS